MHDTDIKLEISDENDGAPFSLSLASSPVSECNVYLNCSNTVSNQSSAIENHTSDNSICDEYDMKTKSNRYIYITNIKSTNLFI